MDRLEAPWTPEQVDALNRYQRNPSVHPFTCGWRDVNHRVFDNDLGSLLATLGGWVCRDCTYTQNWAYLETLEMADIPDPFTDIESLASLRFVCGYQGITGICGKDTFCGCHTEGYGPETFDKHRFRKGMWIPSD